MKIDAPWLTAKSSVAVCAMLTDAGFEAYYVGGCVRNALLNAPVSDLDISTNARPDVVMKLAKTAGLKAIPTGIDHGTVTVVAKGVPFEITTYRRDVETDGRHAVVAFSDTIEDDARRRDFTMNALYADPDGQVRDPLGGLPDLHARCVRFIEDADLRIKEDYLRILRFFRFHAWYGDQDQGIDPEGLAACAANVDGIETLSKERVGTEFLKLLSAPDPAPALASMDASGALMRVIAGAHAPTIAVLVHVESEAALSLDPLRRLAVMGGQDVEAALRLSKADAKRLKVMRMDGSPYVLGYHHGLAAIDTLAVRAASLGQTIAPADIEAVQFAAAQVFPLKAADLMPALGGPALGQALAQAEKRWIASGFTLTKADLIV